MLKLLFTALTISAALSTLADAAKPAPRKMHCICCALGQGQLLDGSQGSYCGGSGGPNTVDIVATPDTYKAIGERACRKNVVDQSQDIYVTSCGYTD